jgi:hypothetical protein
VRGSLQPIPHVLLSGTYTHNRFWGEGVLTVMAQHGEVEDVIDSIPLTGGFDGVGNIGDGSFDVLETRLTLPMDRLGLANARLQARASWVNTEVVDPVTGETRRFQGNQAFGCGVNFNQDLMGGRWSYGFDHGCNIDKGRLFRVREVRALYQEPFITLYAQWKPSPDLTIKIDYANISDRQLGYDRDIYAGPRDVSPVAFREVRRTTMSPWVFLQIRKSF